jgi:hypothetical protein
MVRPSSTLLVLASLSSIPQSTLAAAESTTFYTAAEVLTQTGSSGISGWGSYFEAEGQSSFIGIGTSCISTDDKTLDEAGEIGLQWVLPADPTMPLDKRLEEWCAPTKSVCADIHEEGCTTFFNDAKDLMDLLGWDGYTSISLVL